MYDRFCLSAAIGFYKILCLTIMAQLAVDFGAAGYKVRLQRSGWNAWADTPQLFSLPQSRRCPAQPCTWSRAIWGLAQKRSGMPSPIPREM